MKNTRQTDITSIRTSSICKCAKDWMRGALHGGVGLLTIMLLSLLHSCGNDEEEPKTLADFPDSGVVSTEFAEILEEDIPIILNSSYHYLSLFEEGALRLESTRTGREALLAPWWSYSTPERITSYDTDYAFRNAYLSVATMLCQLIERRENTLALTPGTSREKVLAQIGQAIVLRAFTYYNLAVLWGDVRIYTFDRERNADTPPPPQTPQSEVLQFVLSEIEKALPMLPEQNEIPEETRCLFTRNDALMLKAEVLLTLHQPAVSTLVGIDIEPYNAPMNDEEAIYDGDIEHATPVLLALEMGTAHYQPIYTYRHYQLLLQEAQGETEHLAEAWLEAPCTEYGYWAALKRLGVAQEVTGCQDYELLMPFPKREEAYLRQNPGY